MRRYYRRTEVKMMADNLVETLQVRIRATSLKRKQNQTVELECSSSSLISETR